MSEVFVKTVNMSISASYLVLAVLLLRLALKKAPRWISVLLWGMVAVRLILPVSIESTMSLVPSTEAISEQVVAELRVDVQTEVPQINVPIDDKTETPVHDGTVVQNPVDTTVPAKQGIPVMSVMAAVWMAGVGGMLIYTLVSFSLLRHRVATAVRLKGNIYRSENVDSPFVLGLVRPKIYLSFDMDGEALTHVIAHEEAHIRRRDHWWKPFGFVLLAIHWFNPLMWVGYILLCRDIELACDEKVIREMDNESKATYSEALVACSVNRRGIAACPLAFGEVGVKERVKTVMNYKKPAFWIVIAAIALCIVVAVSFLTDPKGYGPEVGNPKMLEFPGVEWFVTPEELKEALNITEKQILDEDTVLGLQDLHWLTVTDLTLYGREVTYARFGFIRYSDSDFAFREASVMFAENTNMEELEKELAEIYGPGQVEPYSYYLYETSGKRDYEFKLGWEQNLEYAAAVEESLDSVEGNPFRDALEDPDYMIRHWVTENGCSIIPEEIVEYFKYAMDQPWNQTKTELQDDEVLMEMLDQLPWVAITLSNRCAATLSRDANGPEKQFDQYWTNNCMEFNAIDLVHYLHVAKEAQVEDATTATDPTEEVVSVQPPEFADLATLCFPGLNWGMTPEDAKAALDVTDDMITEEKAYDDEWRITLSGSEYFGVGAESVTLRFLQYGGKTSLWNVQVTYPTETDMAAVRDNLVKIYGPGTDYGFTDYEIHNGTVQSYIDWNHTNNIDFGSSIEANAKNPRPKDEINHRWASSTGIEVFTDEEIERFVTLFGDETGTKADRETVLEYLEKKVKVTVLCRDGYADRGLEYRPCVSFTAGFVSFNKLAYDTANPGKDTAAEGSPMSYDLPWLCYPDIAWGATPEDVKNILNVTEEQILLDEPVAKHILHIKDFTFLGQEVLSAQFNFLVSDSGQYHFCDVSLYFPEDTDMAAVKDALTAFYGPSKDGVGFTRYKVSDVATVYEYTDYGADTLFFPEDTPVNGWWESEVTLADALPLDVQNKLITKAVLLNKGDEAFGEAVREYLGKEPAMFIFCTNGLVQAEDNDPYYTKNVVTLSANAYVSGMIN